MFAGRVCLVPAANDLGVGAMRDFRAMKEYNEELVRTDQIIHVCS